MIVITGDSHINAIRLGAVALGPEVARLASREVRIGMLGNGRHTLRPFFSKCDAGAKLAHPQYATALRALIGSDVIGGGGKTFGVCLGFHSPPVFRHPMWHQSRLVADWKGPPERPVSDAVFEVVVRSINQHIYAFFDALVSAGVDFFVISAPPPRRDHYCMAKTPASVVLSVDRAYRALVAKHFDSIGVRYVLPPEDVYAEDGFLLDGFAMRVPRDFHHANSLYGEKMLRRILELDFLRTDR